MKGFSRNLIGLTILFLFLFFSGCNNPDVENDSDQVDQSFPAKTRLLQ